MVNLRLDIAALTRDSSQVTALRAEERQLREDLEARLARGRTSSPSTAASAPVAPSHSTLGTNFAIEQSERVREARARYQDVMDSVNRAQVDLDTARSAFKHRYKVVWPVQVPNKPVSPNPLKIFGIGALASLLLALLAPAAIDWRSGKLLERWQIERGLGLPILGETHLTK